MGERVTLPGGAEGYLARGEGAGLGVLVLGGPPGLCDRFAQEGFTALAPDAPDGPDGPGSPEDDILPAVVEYLFEHPAVRGHGVAVVGFGLGGGMALRVAALRPDRVRAAVPFYATVPPGGDLDWDSIEAAVEGHYGEADDVALTQTGNKLDEVLAPGRNEGRVFLYPNVGADFFDDTRRDAYDEDAARQAWVRTLEFLRAKLG
jgi:carboxymethylenebutenolidase